jgi:transposase-like protein
MAGLLEKRYQDEDAAREHLEKTRWPEGPICPHCGVIGEAFRLQGKTTRKGLWKCSACREPFTVTIGTIFEDSKIPLHKWLLAIHLMCSSKKGISAHQLMRNLDLGSYRTAWFMAHRIRWALGQEPMASKLAGIVEVDDTWIGGKQRIGSGRDEKGVSVRVGKDPNSNKSCVLSALQREGDVRSIVYQRVTGMNARPAVEQFIQSGSHIMTDSASRLKFGKRGWKHSTVDHSKKEYARHEDGLTITTNTVEGYFSIIKRGIHGVYHHVGKHYLDQYLREFDYRYNVRKLDDQERFTLAVKKTGGKRLMLKEPKVK